MRSSDPSTRANDKPLLRLFTAGTEMPPAICCTCWWAWKGEGYRRPRQSVPWPHRLEPPIWRGGFEAHRTDQQTTVEYTTEAAGERCGRVHVLLSAARETIDKGRGRAMIQELKTILIVVSATLAALFVHHALEQAQKAAETVSVPALCRRTMRARSPVEDP